MTWAEAQPATDAEQACLTSPVRTTLSDSSRPLPEPTRGTKVPTGLRLRVPPAVRHDRTIQQPFSQRDLGGCGASAGRR